MVRYGQIRRIWELTNMEFSDSRHIYKWALPERTVVLEIVVQGHAKDIQTVQMMQPFYICRIAAPMFRIYVDM